MIHEVALATYYCSAIYSYLGNKKLSSERSKLTVDLFKRSGDNAKDWRWGLLLASASEKLDGGKLNEKSKLKETIDFIKESTKNTVEHNLNIYLREVLSVFNEKKREKYFELMENEKTRTTDFMSGESKFNKSLSFLMILREWNSYTPAVPSPDEKDRGGGYYIQHKEVGVIIDPGYDFIRVFYEAGGRLCDINHIVITHAHDDHTADFESLRMLLIRAKKINPNINVSLYLSVSVERKFAGLLRLDDGLFSRIVVLNNLDNNECHIVNISKEISMIPLPAYHNDSISSQHSIGVCFEFCDNKEHISRILFTGDTGYLPVKWENGRQKTYHYQRDGRIVEEYVLNDDPMKALPARYKSILDDDVVVDLLVSHIGSIQSYEFGTEKERYLSPNGLPDYTRNLYVNHLGLLGSLMLINELSPKLTIVSEFGGELKDIRIDLVAKLMEALNNKRSKDNLPLSTIIPGDITVIFDISSGKLLIQSDKDIILKSPDEITVLDAQNYIPEYCSVTDDFDVKANNSFRRVCLCSSDELKESNDTRFNDKSIKKFLSDYYNNRLPIHYQNK
jgi:hypothetical protein